MAVPSSTEELEATQEAVRTLVEFRSDLEDLEDLELTPQHRERLRDLDRSVEGHLTMFVRDIDVAADQLGEDLD